MGKKRLTKIIFLYFLIVYVISAMGYYFLLGAKCELAAFIPILAPVIAAIVKCRFDNQCINRLTFQINFKELVIGAGLVKSNWMPDADECAIKEAKERIGDRKK